MQKKRTGRHGTDNVLLNLWKIMRLSVFFLFLFVFQGFASETYSQKTRLTLQMQGVKVIDVLNKIEGESEFFFLFNQKLLDVERQVNVDVENETIGNIISQLFDKTNVSYVIKDRQIILTTANPEIINQAQQKATKGKVTDSSGASIPGVSVIVKGTTMGVITDNSGEFSIINIPANAVLQFSFVGMKAQEVAVASKNFVSV